MCLRYEECKTRVTYFTSRKSLVKYHLRHLRNCHASVSHCRLFTYRLLMTNEQRQRDACRNLQGDIPCNYLTPAKFYVLWSHAYISVGELPSLIPRLLRLQACRQSKSVIVVAWFGLQGRDHSVAKLKKITIIFFVMVAGLRPDNQASEFEHTYQKCQHQRPFCFL